MEISNNISQTVKYRGHGGIESAAPSTSTGHVVLHESRHIREFEAKAALEGKTVRNEQIRIQYELRDGKLIAVSGEATALIADKNKMDTLSRDRVLISEEAKNKLSTIDSDNNKKLQDFERIVDLPPDSDVIMDKIENKLNQLKDDLIDIQIKSASTSSGVENKIGSEKEGKLEKSEQNPLMNGIPTFKNDQHGNNPELGKDNKHGENVDLVL